jgi:hypothetical protein
MRLEQQSDRWHFDMSTATISQLAARRRKRIARELSVLHTTEGHLLTKEILWAILTIPAVAALVILVAVKMHFWSGSPAIAAAAAAASGLAVWWIGRRWFALAIIIVYGLILILLEDLPDLDIGVAARRSSAASSWSGQSPVARRC